MKQKIIRSFKRNEKLNGRLPSEMYVALIEDTINFTLKEVIKKVDKMLEDRITNFAISAYELKDFLRANMKDGN